MAPRSRRNSKLPVPNRPAWSGAIRLSLVSIPVNLFAAIDREGDSHFHQLHRKTGQRIRYLKTVPGLGEIRSEDIVKGYQYEKGQYVVVEPEELNMLRLEPSDYFTVMQLVDRKEIDAIYFSVPYFVAPANARERPSELPA